MRESSIKIQFCLSILVTANSLCCAKSEPNGDYSKLRADHNDQARGGALVAVGLKHSCAVTTGVVRCWGGNEFGQTDIPLLNNPVSVAAGAYNITPPHIFLVTLSGETIPKQMLVIASWGSSFVQHHTSPHFLSGPT